jgi:hypothetical protein
MNGQEPDEAGTPLSENEAAVLRGIERQLHASGLRLRARDAAPAWQNVTVTLSAVLAVTVSVFLMVHGFRMGTETGVLTTWFGLNGLCQSIGITIGYRKGLWNFRSLRRQGTQ